MKVLIVTPFLVLPLAHGGRVRTYRLAVELARLGAKVDVLCPWRPGLPARPFESDGITLHPHAFISSALPLLLPERRVPALVALSWQPIAVGPRRRLRAFSGYDVVQFEFYPHASWMKRVPAGARAVYSAHNVEIDYLRARGQRSQQAPGMFRRVEELERLAVEAISSSPARRRTHPALPRSTGSPRPSSSRTDATTSSWASTARASATRRGHRWVSARTSCSFSSWGGPLTTIGRPSPTSSASSFPASAAERRSRPLFAAADVAVNPVGYGSGSSLKLVEYIAARVPVVTTLVGMRGFERLRDHVVVSELSDFADAVRSAVGIVPPDGGALEEVRWSVGARRLHDAYLRLLEPEEGTG